MTKDERFDHIINVILSNEGEYSDNPDDKGRITKFGISSRSYPILILQTLQKKKLKTFIERISGINTFIKALIIWK